MVASTAARADRYANSPYQSLSSFAGNDLLISPELLIADGLLRSSDCEAHFACDVADYEAVIPLKHRLLEKAWTYFKAGERNDLRPAFVEFCAAQAHRLDDYALFRALKERFQGRITWNGRRNWLSANRTL